MNYVRQLLIFMVLASCQQAQPAVLVPVVPVPSGYLYKVETGIPGKVVYICGERPFNTTGDLVGAGNLASQLRQIFENMKSSLATVDMTLQNVNQITYSVKDVASPDQVTDVNAQVLTTISATYFTQPPQIIAMKAVTQTVRDDVLIEVEVIAVK